MKDLIGKRVGRKGLRWETFCERPSLHVFNQAHTPHWKACEEGMFFGDFRKEPDGALSIDITEQGEKGSKRVMITLTAETVAELRKLIAADR